MVHGRQGHDCLSYLTANGQAVALVAGGVDGTGKPVLETEIYDFSQGRFFSGPTLLSGGGKIALSQWVLLKENITVLPYTASNSSSFCICSMFLRAGLVLDSI